MTVKASFKGISWQNPAFNTIAHIIDVPDGLVRLVKGFSYLPQYSVRIRSNGVTNQFGGQAFFDMGMNIASLLKVHTDLKPNNKIMEIGCGCGRTAYALASFLENSNYFGWDIDRVSVKSCLSSQVLHKKAFTFKHLDVQNALYNPLGKEVAKKYRFPSESGSMNVVFLISVFTHMLPEDVANYIQEITRILKPGGRCMLSTFLLDHGDGEGGITFKHHLADHSIYQKEIPEKAVGYRTSFFENEFAKGNMKKINTLFGSWRNSDQIKPQIGFSQDMLVFEKN